jgi:energy-coupling factor transporter transmembrane protein EcfT
MLATIVIFIVDKLPIYVLLVLILILVRLILLKAIPKVSFLGIKHILNLSLLAVFVILIQTFFGSGLSLGLIITCRIFSLVLIFPILTETTPAYQLASGLYSLGFSYRIAFIITTAFNQVSHFSGEARLIMDAQKLRCLNVLEKRGNYPGKIKAYAGICLPLVLGAIRKARVSSAAMDSRAFGVHKTRTWLDKPKIKPRDYLFILGCCIFAVILLIFNYVNYSF